MIQGMLEKKKIKNEVEIKCKDFLYKLSTYISNTYVFSSFYLPIGGAGATQHSHRHDK